MGLFMALKGSKELQNVFEQKIFSYKTFALYLDVLLMELTIHF